MLKPLCLSLLAIGHAAKVLGNNMQSSCMEGFLRKKKILGGVQRIEGKGRSEIHSLFR